MMGGRPSRDLGAVERARLHDLVDMAISALGGDEWSRVSPGEILSAENLLDLYGEDVRARAFVFDGVGQGDLCLRPDLTLAICRYHLDNAAQKTEAQYCASGPVFRRPRPGEDRAAEFMQVGFEWYGGDDPAEIEAQLYVRTRDVLSDMGCDSVTVETGDLGVLFSLIDAAPIPERWRTRLKRHVWRPNRFHALLSGLSEEGTDDAGRIAFLKALGALEPEQARLAVSHMLALSGTTHVGLRTHDEIATRFLEQAQDAQAHPLPTEIGSAIDKAARLKGSAAEALSQLRGIAQEAGLSIDPALEHFSRRLEALDAAGVDPAALPFDAEFGRSLEYYDGFVFEFYDTALAAQTSRVEAQLAGGGRYDGMMAAAARAFGGANPAAAFAFGLAIRPETVMAATRGAS